MVLPRHVAPPSDPEAWVVRAGWPAGAEPSDGAGDVGGGRGGAAAGGSAAQGSAKPAGISASELEISASDLELWEEARGGLRNRATRALLNFRGLEAAAQRRQHGALSRLPDRQHGALRPGACLPIPGRGLPACMPLCGPEVRW